MNIIKLLSTALLALVFIAPASAEQTLRLGTEGAYPPFNFVNKDGSVGGFDIDIGNALCAQMKVKCTWVAQDWDGIIPALNAHKFDAVIASMSITPEREKAVSFTNPYYSNKLQFVGPKAKPFAPTAAAMKGMSVGAQRATIAAQWLDQHMKNDVTTKLYDTQENAYLDLASGRLNAILADKYVTYKWLQTKDGAGFAFMGQPVYSNDKIAIAVRKNDNALRNKLNAALKTIVANGTYAKINSKYFPFSIY
jgi:polar amino acid transport system substrate-binding protein